MSGGVPRTSGQTILDQHVILEEIAGKAVVARVVDALPPDMREEYRTLLAIGWCRLTIDRAVVTGVAEALGRELVEFQSELVRRSFERTLNTVWRVIMRFTSDEALVKRAAILYSKTLQNCGELSAAIPRPGHLDARLSGWTTAEDYDLKGISVGIETVLRVAGRKDVKVVYTRRPDGAQFTGTWAV